MTGSHKTLILGIGNVLLQDEGAGVHAIRMLAERVAERDDIELMDGGTLSFSLAGAIEDAEHLIVIDAAQYDMKTNNARDALFLFYFLNAAIHYRNCKYHWW